MADRKRLTLAALGRVCSQIEQILAGQNVTLADIPLIPEPGETKLERLQRFKALLNRTLAGISAGESPVCAACNATLGAALLDEMPWADRCRTCAA